MSHQSLKLSDVHSHESTPLQWIRNSISHPTLAWIIIEQIALQILNIPPRPHIIPLPYLQMTEPGETASSTQSPETSFWLPGAFWSSPPAIYTAAAEGQRADHCESEQLPAPIRNVERRVKQEKAFQIVLLYFVDC